MDGVFASYEDLKDPAYASAYINEAILDGDEAVLKTALADVIRAKGVAAVARKAGINRVTAYSKTGVMGGSII